MEHYAELAASMEETSFVLCKACQSADWSEALAKFGKQAKSVEMMLFSNQLDAPALAPALERFRKVVSQTDAASGAMAAALERERELFVAAVQESVKRSELVPVQPLLLASGAGAEKELAQLRAKVALLEREVYSDTRRCILHLVQASELASADPNGQSDPYISIKNMRNTAGAKIETAVCKETLNPVWDESFELDLPLKFRFNAEIFDWSKDRKPQYLGYVEINWSEWSLEGIREERRWLPVEDGSGSVYVGLRACQFEEDDQGSGEAQAMRECNCCKEFGKMEAFACESCSKATCALCLALKKCHLCSNDGICKRARLLASQKRAASQRGTRAEEIAKAKMHALVPDVKDWPIKRYEWPTWQADAASKEAAAAANLRLPGGYVYEIPGREAYVNLEMLDPYETYDHFTRHLIKVDCVIFVGMCGDIPVVVIVERLLEMEQDVLALVYSPEGTFRSSLHVSLREALEQESKKKGRQLSMNKRMSDTMRTDSASASSSSNLRLFLKETFPGLSLNRVPWSAHQEIQAKLLEYERNHTDQRRRIGILYVPAGVTDENEMFSSVETPALTEFLEMMGERVRLLGWDKYAGGLNTKEDSTGTHSIYTQFMGFEIMFHVNCLLFDDGSEQKLSRKRYIGNDLVVFIFMESETDVFDPSTITSQMCHTFIIVRKIAGSDPTKYRINIVAKSGVPEFSPALPEPNVLLKGEACRNFLLAKALNGNRATFRARTFVQKTRRTRKDLLGRMRKDLIDDGLVNPASAVPIDEISSLALTSDNFFVKSKSEFKSEATANLAFGPGEQIYALMANPEEGFWTGFYKDKIGRFPVDKVEIENVKKRK